MQSSRKTVSLNKDLISILDKRKDNSNKSYNDVIFSALKSPTPTQTGNTKIIGAGAGLDAYGNYEHQLGWISDTSKKMIASGLDHPITPSMREQAYDIEPLVSGIIGPFLKNVILSDYSIETNDNKKFSAFIEEAEAFIDEIKLMTVYRDDFEDLAIKHGGSYRRKDYKGNSLYKLQRLECRAMKTYEDPFDSDIVLYHQNIYATDIFSSTTTSTNSAINSWWIPDGLPINVDQDIGDEKAWNLWTQYLEKYYINETNRLRVGDSADILAMHFRRPGKPAPIDSIIQVIWEKRAVTANLPNLIFSVLYPFIQIIHGTMVEKIDANGNKYLATSVPQPASSSDPEINAQEAALYSAFQAAMKKNSEDIIKYRHEGGSASTGPDIAIKILESASSIAPGFIATIFKHFNDEIGQGLGFPMSLVMASGNELATSRTIKEMFNTVYAGITHDYEYNADELIKERFAGKSWEYELTNKDGTVEKGKYTFEDTGAEFTLNKGDVTDNLKVAQTELLQFQAMQVAKTIGATKADIQAYMASKGQDGWDMLNFDVKLEPANPWGALPKEEGVINKAEIPQIGKPALPADAKIPSISEQIQSSISITEKQMTIDAPSVIPKKIDKTLMEGMLSLYEACQESIQEAADKAAKGKE